MGAKPSILKNLACQMLYVKKELFSCCQNPFYLDCIPKNGFKIHSKPEISIVPFNTFLS